MNILIISSCELPIPAIKGGAVETLISLLVAENENSENNINVISLYDFFAEKESINYKKAKFFYQKKSKFIDNIDNIYEKIYQFITKKEHRIKKRYLWKYVLINRIKKIIKKNEFDTIIFENAGFLLKILKDNEIKSRYKNNIYYHLHNDVPSNISSKDIKLCKFVLVSNYLKKGLKEKYDIDPVQYNISILKNGFCTEIFCQNLSCEENIRIRKELNIDLNQKIILFTGRTNKEKGIEELIEAFLKMNDEKFTLLIVGANNFGQKSKYFFEEKLKKSIANSDKIKFTGFVRYDEIWKYYKIAYIVVLPSVWQEPAGLTMLETIESGIPLITTDVGGIKEYINNTSSIILKVDQDLINNIVKSIKIIDNNYEYYKKEMEKSSQKLSQIYNEYNFYNNFISIISRKDKDEKNI